jgi:hypothetical protein
MNDSGHPKNMCVPALAPIVQLQSLSLKGHNTAVKDTGEGHHQRHNAGEHDHSGKEVRRLQRSNG